MFGLDLTAVASLLVLAGNNIVCTVPKAPNISINPTSAPIEYEFSLTGEQLSQFQNNTVNPYAPNVDTTTGGLRHDRPKVSTEVSWGVLQYPDRQLACLWYESIDITIELSPKIYVAKEHDDRACREAIVAHEVKHVDVDREVINQYAQDIGLAVKQAVDQIGPMGPYNFHELDNIRESLVSHIRTAVDSQKFLMHKEMKFRQAQVDSLEEYEAINAICEETKR